MSPSEIYPPRCQQACDEDGDGVALWFILPSYHKLRQKSTSVDFYLCFSLSLKLET